MRLDEIELRRLVRLRGAREEVVEQIDDISERVAEDAAHVAQHVDARTPAQLGKGHQLIPYLRAWTNGLGPRVPMYAKYEI